MIATKKQFTSLYNYLYDTDDYFHEWVDSMNVVWPEEEMLILFTSESMLIKFQEFVKQNMDFTIRNIVISKFRDYLEIEDIVNSIRTLVYRG